MPNLRTIKEPGYIYDLFTVFFLKFNIQFFSDNIVNGNKKAEDTAYFNQIINEFEPIPEDLFVFFHALENGRCFMANSYFNEYKEKFATNFNFEFLQEELKDHDKLIRKLLKFYFYSISPDDIERYLKSNVGLFNAIKETDYNDTVKSKLYEFFIDPSPYIQKLQYELMSKEIRLAQYYEKNYKKIMDVQSETTYDVIHDNFKLLHNDTEFLKSENQILYTSFCLINKNCLNLIFCGDGAVYLLGYDYADAIEYVKRRKKEPKLEEFGSILCEESRVKILYLLLEREEISCKDLEKALNISGSTAYHHLTMMMRLGLIKTRNEGKTILYKLNNGYFDVVIDILSRFSNKQKGNRS